MKVQGSFRSTAVIVVLSIALFGIALPIAATELGVCTNGGANSTLTRVSTKGSGNPEVLVNFTTPCEDVKALDSSTVYVSIPANNAVEAVNVNLKNAVSVQMASSPQKMVLNDARTRLYVATSTNVTVIDTATNSVVPGESIELAAYGGNAYAIALKGKFLAVGTALDVHLFDISGIPFHVGQINIRTRPQDILFDDGGTMFYVACESLTNIIDENGADVFGNLLVVRISPLSFKAALMFGFGDLQNLAKRDQYVYVTSSAGTLYWFDATKDALPDTTFLIVNGNIMDIDIDGNAYVGNQSFGNIQIVRTSRKSPASDTLDGTLSLPTGTYPQGIALIPAAPRGRK